MKATVTYNSAGVAEYKIDGELVGKEEFDQRFPSKPIEPPNVQSTTTWPRTDVAAIAGHPDQVDELNARAKKHNIAAHYNKKGHCITQDLAALKAIIRLEGFKYAQ